MCCPPLRSTRHNNSRLLCVIETHGTRSSKCFEMLVCARAVTTAKSAARRCNGINMAFRFEDFYLTRAPLRVKPHRSAISAMHNKIPDRKLWDIGMVSRLAEHVVPLVIVGTWAKCQGTSDNAATVALRSLTTCKMPSSVSCAMSSCQDHCRLSSENVQAMPFSAWRSTATSTAPA